MTDEKIPKPYQVIEKGTDTSGRKILMNRRMESAFDLVTDALGWVPTIVQGAYMARLGGGAADSAGYHDAGGCIDTRTWDRTDAELDDMVREGSRVAFHPWRRSQAHGGMDEHAHWVHCGDRDAGAGAKYQMASVARGGDGLSPEGPDYELPNRVQPVVTEFDYYETEREERREEAMTPEDFKKLRDMVQAEVKPLRTAISELRKNTRTRDAELRAELASIAADIDNAPAETRTQIRKLFGPRLRAIQERLDAALPPTDSAVDDDVADQETPA